jgi:uncharacterized RDD family membrane protein YckC
MTMTNPYAPPRAAVQDVAVADDVALPAERGARLGAAILDGIIFTAMVYLPLIFTATMAGAADRAGREGDPVGMVVVGGLVTLAGGIAWCWLTTLYVLRNGQSIAKKLLKIKVVRSDGSRASFARIFWLRNIVNGLLSLIPLYGLIDVLFIFGESRQCLHDKIADTIVIKD